MLFRSTTFNEQKESSNYIDVEKQKTGNKKSVYTISFYDKNFKIMRNIEYKDYTIENKTHEFKFGDYTFPIKIVASTFYEVEKVESNIDKDKLKEELRYNVKKELDYTIPVSARIVDAKEKFNISKNMIEYVLTVTTSEDIAQLDMLTKQQAEQIIKENNEKLEEDGTEHNSNPEKRPIDDIRNDFEEDKKEETEDSE